MNSIKLFAIRRRSSALFGLKDMTPLASGAHHQPERSEASTDKLIARKAPPIGMAFRFLSEKIARDLQNIS
jgi:hypothetical protein